VGSRYLPECPKVPGWGSRAGGSGSGTVVCLSWYTVVLWDCSDMGKTKVLSSLVRNRNGFPISGSISIASFSLTSQLLDLGFPVSVKPEKQCGDVWPFSWKKVRDTQRRRGCADPSPRPWGTAA